MSSQNKRKSPADDDTLRASEPKRRSAGGGGIRWKEKPKKSDTNPSSAQSHVQSQSGQRHDREGVPRKSPSPPPTKPAGTPSLPVQRPAEDDKNGDALNIASKFGSSAIRDAQVDLPEDDTGLDVASKFGAAAAERVKKEPAPPTINEAETEKLEKEKRKKEKKEKKQRDKPFAPPKTNEPMIEVIVNDRLGSKSRIACLGSDKVGDFKKLVAMQIGRKPHEIMLKRQSERPFKDFLTLDDYSVNNGVQLDLELDTGD